MEWYLSRKDCIVIQQLYSNIAMASTNAFPDLKKLKTFYGGTFDDAYILGNAIMVSEAINNNGGVLMDFN